VAASPDLNNYTATVYAQCRTDIIDAIDNTWGTGVVMAFSNDFAQNIPEFSLSAAVTPDGSATCASKAVLAFKIVTDTSSTADDASINYINLAVTYTGRVAE
jgi:hypothetical protein